MRGVLVVALSVIVGCVITRPMLAETADSRAADEQMRGHYKAAVAFAHRALWIDSSLVPPQARIVRIEAESGDRKLALADADAFLKREPSAQVERERARVMFATRSYREAGTQFDQLFQRPDYGTISYSNRLFDLQFAETAWEIVGNKKQARMEIARGLVVAPKSTFFAALRGRV